LICANFLLLLLIFPSAYVLRSARAFPTPFLAIGGFHVPAQLFVLPADLFFIPARDWVRPRFLFRE
jgi:hypothetical protein